MTEDELQARVTLLALLPPDSEEQDTARKALVLQILPSRPQEALNLAWKWWEVGGDERIPEVDQADEAVSYLPGLREIYDTIAARRWCRAMLADSAVPTAWFVPVLRCLAQREWPVEALLNRWEQQPSEALLAVLLPCSLAPDWEEALVARLLRMALPWADAYRDALGDMALRSPLVHSQMLLGRAKRTLGQTEGAKKLLGGVREARFILKLRLRRRTRRLDRWLSRVDARLEARPPTDFNRALRQEIRYFAYSRKR